MPRLLAALVMIILLIGYYIYKTQILDAPKEIKKEQVETKPEVKKVKKVKPVSQKKKDFYAMMVPPLNEVYDELQKEYIVVKELISNDPNNAKVVNLKKKYRVKSNEELLIALKPHPKSIAIAQGAMESAWGTSRFYEVAYNIFGVWSFNKNDKRVAAGETRGDKTIWLKKYDSVKESIQDYYLTMSRSKAFKEFKRLNYEKQNQNPYLLVKKLDRYSEKGALYGQELASMISYNDFTKHDAVVYEKPIEKLETAQKVSQADTESTLNKEQSN